jgi:hypothetical protein
VGVFAGPEIVEDGLVLALDVANSKSYDSTPRGQQTYTSSGSYSWTCPSGVTSVSVVCIGGGGGGNGGGNGVGGAGGGGGGGLGYKNNIPVTPGQSYTVVVGGGGAGDYWSGPPYSTDPADSGGDSYFIDATTVKGGGGGGGNGNSGAAGGSGGTYVGDGGGNGYSGGTGSSGGSASGYLPATGGGGGSTGTYTGNATTRGTSKYITSNCTSGCLAGSGTGQGLLGDGSSGSYGAGGGANMETFSNGTSGYTGAVRIMWGPDRSYPSTNVADQSGSTIFNDLSGRGNNGTLTNGPIFSGFNSLDFDGSDDYISETSALSDSFLQGNWTISFWANFDTISTTSSSGSDRPLLHHGSSSQRNGLHLTQRNSKIRFGLYSDDLDSTSTLSTGTWYNIVFTLNNTTYAKQIYINGTLDSSHTGSGAYTGTGSNTRIGGKVLTFGLYFDGKISSVTSHSGILTASEIKQNFNALRGRFGI